jgi:ACS family glucarate transporter-like MFS transporter
MLFIATTINYADRATISIAGPAISKELGLDAVGVKADHRKIAAA